MSAVFDEELLLSEGDTQLSSKQVAELVAALQACQATVNQLIVRLDQIEQELKQRDETIQHLVAFLNDNSQRMTAGHAVVVDILVDKNLTTDAEMQAMYEATLEHLRNEIAAQDAAQSAAQSAAQFAAQGVTIVDAAA